METALSSTDGAPDMAISTREKFAFGIGDLASGLMWQSVGMFLMFFYTDVYGLSAAVAGSILFVARASDAVWDLFLGYAIDRTRTRWGRCRPYLLFAPPLLLVMAAATFSVPSLEGSAKLAYAYITYIGLMFAYSLANLPYCAMPALISADPADRVRLSSWRMFMAYGAALVVSSTMLPLVQWYGGGDKAAGFRQAILTMAVLSLLLFWFCFANTRERVDAPVHKPDFRAELRVLLKSRAWWTLFGAAILQFTAAALPLSSALYFLTYVVGRAEWASGYFVTGTLGALTGVLVSSQLTRRFCKRQVVIATTAASAGLLLMLPLVDMNSRAVLYAWTFGVSPCAAIKSPIIWSMVSDAADLVELQSGRRVVGLVTSSVAFAHKFGLGVGSGLAGLLLAWFGYSAGAAQSAEAQSGITWLVSTLPACLYLLLAALYKWYPLNRVRLDALRDDLALQRQAAVQ